MNLKSLEEKTLEEKTTIDLSKCRVEPRSYQIEGVRRLVNQKYLLLADQMRLGKSKQVIDAVQVLHQRELIDRVIVVCPGAVRSVWFDPELGQIAQHVWKGTINKVTDYHGKNRQWKTSGQGRILYWVVTNYEFLRSPDRLNKLLKVCGSKTVFVLDESSAIKSYKAIQTQSCLQLRQRCGRVYLLNGTPVSHSPGDMFAQAEMMSPKILQVSQPRKDGSVRPMSGYYQFRGKYAVLGGWQSKQIVKWKNLDDLQFRLSPFVLRRLTKDQFDLPPEIREKLTVNLTDKTWGIYTSMRDELIAWLDTHTVAVAAQAGAKVMRLSQITSGIVGGVQCEECVRLERDGCPLCQIGPVREISREKLDFVLEWLKTRISEEASFRAVIWFRFRAELARAHRVISELLGVQGKVSALWGGQSGEEREEALRTLHPQNKYEGPGIVLGTPSTGSMGVNMAGAHHELFVSNDVRLSVRLQAEARVSGPEQKDSVWIGDIIASGPEGQKTIDHKIVKALAEKENLAILTTKAWVQVLREEMES